MKKTSIVKLLIVCFVQTALGLSNKIDPSAVIDLGVRLGSFLNIGHHAKVHSGADLGSFCNVRPYATIGCHTNVGSFASVGERTVVGNNVNLDKFANIGRQNTIGDDCRLALHSHTGTSVKLEENVQMKMYSKVGDNAEVAANAVLHEYAKVGPNSKIGEGVYLGENSEVGENTTIGSKAVIHDSAHIGDGREVPSGNVIIKTPTANDLYVHSASFETLQTASNIRSISTDATEFSNLIDDILHKQSVLLEEQLKSNETRNNVDLVSLPVILSLYLIKCHGEERFNKYKEVADVATKQSDPHSFVINIDHNTINVMKGSYIFINGKKYSPPPKDIPDDLRELHFTSSTQPKILNPQQEKKIIQLLAIDQDNKRAMRFGGDTLSEMIRQIQNDERQVQIDSIYQS